MIITRTPLRISLGGGGTDLPSYYEKFAGHVISAAIDKYVYITVNRTFRPDYLLKYSRTEQVDNIDDIQHDLIRESLRILDIGPNIEIVSIADVPAGTGLGSSGSFTVGLLHALNAYKRHPVSPEYLARKAYDIERNILCEPCGKQDQYISAYGGVMCQDYHPDGNVTITPLKVRETTLRELSEHLMMFFTGYSRTAYEVLEDQKVKSEQGDDEMLDNLHFIKDLGLRIRSLLEQGNTADFAEMMHQHWMRKKERSTNISNTAINDIYDYARQHGALGGKLVGAGGGGFMLFYTNDRSSLRRAMEEKGLNEMAFSFDFDGSVVLLRN